MLHLVFENAVVGHCAATTGKGLKLGVEVACAVGGRRADCVQIQDDRTKGREPVEIGAAARGDGIRRSARFQSAGAARGAGMVDDAVERGEVGNLSEYRVRNDQSRLVRACQSDQRTEVQGDGRCSVILAFGLAMSLTVPFRSKTIEVGALVSNLANEIPVAHLVFVKGIESVNEKKWKTLATIAGAPSVSHRPAGRPGTARMKAAPARPDEQAAEGTRLAAHPGMGLPAPEHGRVHSAHHRQPGVGKVISAHATRVACAGGRCSIGVAEILVRCQVVH